MPEASSNWRTGRAGVERLFAKCPGYRGTALLRDTNNPQRYLTFDSWDTEAQRDAMLTEHGAEYSRLDAEFRAWTTHEAEIGVYRILAEALVRPSLSKRRGETATRRRGGRGKR
jgi:hypothetical protein